MNYNNNDRQNHSAAPAAFLLPGEPRGEPQGEPIYASPALLKSNTVKTLESLPRLHSLCYHHLIGAVEGSHYKLMMRVAIVGGTGYTRPGCQSRLPSDASAAGFLPLLENDLVDLQGLIADAQSGASGVARKAVPATRFCEAGGSFQAYSVADHRHEAKILKGLSSVTGHDTGVTFVPHLVPMRRGMARHGIS